MLQSVRITPCSYSKLTSDRGKHMSAGLSLSHSSPTLGASLSLSPSLSPSLALPLFLSISVSLSSLSPRTPPSFSLCFSDSHTHTHIHTFPPLSSSVVLISLFRCLSPSLSPHSHD